MDLTGQRLGILLSTRPDQAPFQHAVNLARVARARGVEVSLYCLDEAVRGLEDPRLKALAAAGARLYACAYALRERGLSLEVDATLAGLALLSDLVGSSDRFVAFN